MSEFDALLVAGCSNSYGSEALKDEDDTYVDCINNSYGKFIQESLNIPNYYNVAKSGYSNFSISFSCITALKKLILKYPKNKILVIVGWSDPQRFSVKIRENSINISAFSIHQLFKERNKNKFTNNQNKAINYIKSIPNLAEFLKNLFIFYLNTDLALKQDMLNKISLESMLKNMGVRYFTFPTLDELIFDEYFFLRTFLDKKNSIFTFRENSELALNNKKTLNNNYFNQFASFMKNTFKNNAGILDGVIKDYSFFKDHYSYRCFNMMNSFSKYGSSSSGGHLRRSAHIKLAEFLIDTMRSRDIISK